MNVPVTQLSRHEFVELTEIKGVERIGPTNATQHNTITDTNRFTHVLLSCLSRKKSCKSCQNKHRIQRGYDNRLARKPATVIRCAPINWISPKSRRTFHAIALQASVSASDPCPGLGRCGSRVVLFNGTKGGAVVHPGADQKLSVS